MSDLPAAHHQFPMCGACHGDTWHDTADYRCDDCGLSFDSDTLEAHFTDETARAEGAEVALADAETPTLDEIAEREPWRVLRAVDAMIRGHWNFDGHDSGRLLALADEMEREHGETAKRDRLIGKLESATREAVETVAGEFMRAGIVDGAGWESMVNIDYTNVVETIADLILAEVVDQ